LSTCYEAPSIRKLCKAVATIASDKPEREPGEARADGSSPNQSSDRNNSLDIRILEAYCSLIQGWRMFHETPCYVQEIPLPLQISLPTLHKYPPASRHLSNAEIESVLSCRAEKRLRLSCFARRGPGALRRAGREFITVFPIALYCLCPATTNALSIFNDVNDHNCAWTRFVGSVAEMSACLQTVLLDIWDDAENQLTAWEQLYLRACVKLYFSHFWKTRPS
jgi:hypothetical protein